jgi:hypothetical protein
MGLRVITCLSSAALAFLPSAAEAHGCGGTQGRSPLPSMPQFSQPQTYCQRQLYAMHQYAQLQALARQRALLIALQQQQQAVLVAQPLPPNAVLMGQPPPPNPVLMARQPPRQQANALPPGLWRPPQEPGQAQLRPMMAPDPNVPPPEDPVHVAARQLSLARELVADAAKVERQGEPDRAAMMRQRAGERLQDIVAKFPGTKAADAAQELLRKLVP